jgi:regulator of protease activity HflC (stomatin/prohibitin superfamily)
MKNEKTIETKSGYLFLFLGLLLILSLLINILITQNLILIPITIILTVVGIFICTGLIIVNPNESRVLILFGNYKGTVKENGFFWVNPFYVKKKISFRAQNIDSEPIKVNDKLGNPILIGAVLVWKVEDTYKAAFEVENYINFVKIQTESAIRKLAHTYPYDNFDDEEKEISLRSGGDEINQVLEHEIRERLSMAGISVMEARISNLSYAPEIASAMLQRQQATAIIAARTKIVEGAVSMVETALHKLSEKRIIDFDDEKKASMISNLMVVLCSDKSASPIINAGTLHH